MKQRESRYVKVAKLAYRLTKQALPKYSHAKSPHHFELPQLAACVLMMFYLNKSYRDVSLNVGRIGNPTYAAPPDVLVDHGDSQ